MAVVANDASSNQLPTVRGGQPPTNGPQAPPPKDSLNTASDQTAVNIEHNVVLSADALPETASTHGLLQLLGQPRGLFGKAEQACLG